MARAILVNAMGNQQYVISHQPAEGWPVNFTPKDVGLGPYPAAPVPKVDFKMWCMAGDDAARQCCLEEMLERYRFTGERQLFDEVCATWESFSTNTVTGASDMQLLGLACALL